MVTVCTVLPPPERPRIDAAGDGCFDTLHADSLREALYVARRRRVDAVIISVHRCHGEALPGVARFVREFPAIPAVALVSRHDREATETLLRLGATGVRSAIDCTEPDGWRRLRDLVGHPASPVAARILARLGPALGDASEETRLFFEAVARLAPALSTVRGLARHLRVGPSTLMSRFHTCRAALAEELSRGHAVAARRVPLPEPRPVGLGRGVPDGLLVAAEFWPSSARGARRYGWGISPPFSVRRGAGALHRSAHHPVPGGPARAPPLQRGVVGPRPERRSGLPGGVIPPLRNSLP